MEGFKVTGKVVDKTTGRGIPLAQVSLPGTRFGVITDAEGNFTVEHVPGPADYTVTIDARRMHPGRATARVGVEGDTELCRLPAPPHHRPAADGEWGYPPPYGYTCVHEPTQWIEGGARGGYPASPSTRRGGGHAVPVHLLRQDL